MSNNKIILDQLTIDRTVVVGKPKVAKIYLALLSVFVLVLSTYWVYGETRQSTNAEISALPTALTKPTSDSSDLAITTTALPQQDQGTAIAITSVLDASGHVVARRIATVSSRVTGKLNRLNIEEGQRVVAAQVLAELDDQQAQISYQLALAELAAKEAIYNEFTLMHQQESQRYARRKELLANKLISEQLVDDARFQSEQLAAQVANKKAMVTLAKVGVEMAQYQLSEHKIRAPFDGVVISKNAQVGELISAGSSGGGFIRTGVGTIVDMSSLEIEVEVGESYINRVFVGQAVIATLDAYPQWQIKSEVEAVIPTADRQKASIKVRVKLLAIDQRILPDMGVKVSFFS